MDYYTKKRAAARAQERRQARNQLIKDIAAVVVTLPVLWLITVLFLCI